MNQSAQPTGLKSSKLPASEDVRLALRAAGLKPQSIDEQFAVAFDQIGQLQAGLGFFGEGHGDADSVVEAGRAVVGQAGLEDGQQEAVLLELAVGGAELVEQGDAGHLEPRQVVAVVDRKSVV